VKTDETAAEIPLGLFPLLPLVPWGWSYDGDDVQSLFTDRAPHVADSQGW
jgi:hypothetical protein